MNVKHYCHVSFACSECSEAQEFVIALAHTVHAHIHSMYSTYDWWVLHSYATELNQYWTDLSSIDLLELLYSRRWIWYYCKAAVECIFLFPYSMHGPVSAIDPPPLICCILQESTSFSPLCTWDKQTLNMTQRHNHMQEEWQGMFYTITQLFDVLFITLLTHLSQTCYRSRLKYRWMWSNHREGFNENELQLVYVQLCT